MPGLTARPLQAADHEEWRRLWRGHQAFYKAELPQEMVALTWSRLLDPDEPVHGAVAVEGGTAVGIVHWIRHRSCWTAGDYAYLQDLFVAEDRRGRGAGRKLIEHVYEAARVTGCSRVIWLTHESNDEAMQLYDRIAERTGFVQYRRILS